ncbi:hypothetical protein TRFO_25171 [Tritrichomonas foetus]|uniref:Uncharacterized protein n=1 Tax=Tritrichomonas foetus TaxID=1144522 RepID=A0A1J4KAM0_9EUKA|nr:hypothetical protein TRFO_25171 [Tritrichomonas foetus]|eukprot:OHT06710.1 hypothetical protein TRFO_25171 [Tritrichomonas foetus]
MSYLREGSSTPTRTFGNRAAFTPDFVKSYTSKAKSPFSNSIKSPKAENSSNKTLSPTTGLKINEGYKRSITIAQNSAKLNSIRRDLTQLKSGFSIETDMFRSFLSQSKNEIFKMVQKQNRELKKKYMTENSNDSDSYHFSNSNNYNTSVNSFKNSNNSNNSATKIAALEKHINELTEQLKTARSNDLSLQVQKLEEELKEKDIYIEEIEQDHLQEVANLKQQIAEQNDIIRDFKSQRFHLIQLQAQIDDKNRTIERLKDDIAKTTSELDSQVQSNETAADDIQYTMDTINQLKNDLINGEEQNKSLNIELSKIKYLLESEQEKNEALSNQITDANSQIAQLKTILSSKDKEIENVNQKNLDIIHQLGEKEQIIDEQMTEISVLNAEKSIASPKEQLSPQQSMNVLSTYSMNMKNVQKYKIENLSLKSQIEKLNAESKEQQNLISALRLNLQQSEESLNHIKDQLMNSQSSFDRKEMRMHSFKEEIVRLQSVISQKEKLISELMNSDNTRSKEIERLHMELEMSKNKPVEQAHIDERLHNQFNEISQELSESRTKINDLDLLNKKLNSTIKELKQENESQNHKISHFDREIARLNQENLTLRSANENTSMQAESTIKRLQRELSSLQEQFESTVFENKSFSEKYNDLMKNIQTNTEKADKLFIQNNELKKENTALFQQINTELRPMKDENKRLKTMIEKFRNTEKSITDDNTRMFTENAILKKTSAKEISILKETISNKDEQISSYTQEIEKMKNESEKWSKLISKLCKIYKTDKIENMIDLSKQTNEIIDIMKKDAVENKALISKLQNDIKNLHGEISECRMQMLTQSQTIESRVKDLNISKDSISILQTKLTETEIALAAKTRDWEDLEDSFERSHQEFDTLHDIIEFTTVESLGNAIQQIQGQNQELDDELNGIRVDLEKANNEKKKLKLQINDLTKKNAIQSTQIDRLTQKLEEARSMVTEESSSSHTATLSLRKLIDEKDNEIDLMKYEFERFHSIISYARVEDLFSTVSALLDSKNQEIEKLNFANSQAQTKYNQKISEMTNNIEKLQNQIKGLLKVKDEKSFYTNKVKLLETEISAAKNGQQNAENNLEIAQQKIEKIVLAMATFTKCEKPEDIEVVLDVLRSKLALSKEKIREAQAQYAVLEDENAKLKSEIDTIRSTSFEQQNTNERKEIEMKMKDNENLVFFGVNSIDQLQQKYSDLLKSIDKYQLQTKTQEIEIQKLNDQMKLKVSAIDNITNERDSLSQMNQQLVRKFNEVEELYLELKEKNITLTKNYQKASDDIKELKNQYQGVNEEKHNAVSRIQTITVEKSSMSSQIRDLTKINQRLTLEINDLNSEIQKLKTQCGSLETENTNSNQVNNNLSIKNSTLNDQFDKIKAENEQLTKSLASQNEIKKELAQTITELKVKIEALSNEKETTSSHNSTLKSKFGMYSEKIEETQEKLSKATEELDEAKIEIKQLRIKFESQAQQISTLIVQNKKYYDDSQTMATKYEQAQSDNRRLLSKATSLELQVKRLSNENDDLNKSAYSEITELDDLRVENQSLKLEKESLENHIDFLRSEGEKISKQFDFIVIENDTLKTDLRLLKNKVKTLENDTKAIRQQNIAFSNQNNQLMSENKSLTADNRLLLSKNSTYNVQQKSITDANEALTKQNEELKSQISALKIENNTQISQLKSVSAQLEAVQQKYAQLTVLFESADSKAKQSTSELQVARTSIRTLTSNNKALQKRNETLVAENDKLSTSNTSLKMTAAETTSKNTELTQKVDQMTDLIKKSTERIKSLQEVQQENQGKMVQLKKRLRLSNKQVSELESAKRKLVIQANELDVLKQNLAEYDDALPACEVVSSLIKKNEDLQVTMEKSKAQSEAYHKETDKTIQQCNNFMTNVLDMITDGNVKDFALPLTNKEVDQTLKTVTEYKNRYIKQRQFLDRIIEEAGNIGYDGDDAETAIVHISRFITEQCKNGEVEELHRTITDITSASDKRKQASRAYLDKVKGKLLKAHRKNDILREIIVQLINLKIESENLNLQVLLDNLEDDDLEILGLKKERI